MKLSQVAVVAFVSASTVLSACSESDTLLSVNVEEGEATQPVDSITVQVVSPGQNFTYDFAPPTKAVEVEDPNAEPAAGGAGGAVPVMMEVQVLDAPFYERITLPDSFDKKGRATITVTAYYQGAVTTSDETEVTIRPNEAVAAFVDLSGAEPEPTEPTPGAGGQGGAGAVNTPVGGVSGAGN